MATQVAKEIGNALGAREHSQRSAAALVGDGHLPGAPYDQAERLLNGRCADNLCLPSEMVTDHLKKDTGRSTEPLLGIKIQWPYNSGRDFVQWFFAWCLPSNCFRTLDTPTKVEIARWLSPR